MLAKLATERQSARAIDLALFAFERSPENPELANVRELLEVSRVVRIGGSECRLMAKAEAVPEFEELELERFRRVQVVLAVERSSLEVHSETIEDTLASANRTGGASLTASVRGWAGFLEYRRANYLESAAQCAFAAEHADTVLSRPSALSNLTMALEETPQLELGLEHARRGIALSARIRIPFFEFRFRRLERGLEYRLERASVLDEGLIAASEKLLSPAETGPALLNQAAVAWRLDTLDRARSLSLAAAERFGGVNSAPGVTLAHALATIAGHDCTVAEAERYIDAAADGPIGVRLQARELYRMAVWALERQERVIQGHLPATQQAGVLSVNEYRVAWSVDGVGQVPESPEITHTFRRDHDSRPPTWRRHGRFLY
ncbi:MAG: hypothetical protein ACJAYU_005327, partial [Bradymonadia bacterium]